MDEVLRSVAFEGENESAFPCLAVYGRPEVAEVALWPILAASRARFRGWRSILRSTARRCVRAAPACRSR